MQFAVRIHLKLLEMMRNKSPLEKYAISLRRVSLSCLQFGSRSPTITADTTPTLEGSGILCSPIISLASVAKLRTKTLLY